jgi:flagellar motor switch protein FliG
VSATTLTGPERALLLLLCFDEDLSSEVLRHFDEDDLRRLAEQAKRTSALPSNALDDACNEFIRKMEQPILPRGADGYLKRLAAASHGPERAEVLFADEKPSAPIEILRSVRSSTLSELLADEHPQMIAVLLSQLPRSQAAQVVKEMDEARQRDVLRRLASLEEVPSQLLERASEALVRTMSASGRLQAESSRRPFDGVAFAAGLLNELPGETSEKLLAALESADGGAAATTATGRTLAAKLREAMFTFEDLRGVPARNLQVLLREVPTERLLVAMKTASEKLRDHFFSAMSSRAAAAMREDLASLPPARLSEVEEAQREILEVARRIAAEGRLTLPTGGGEKMV